MPEVLGECPDCKEEVLDARQTKAVKCDLCSNWYHVRTKCQKVEDQIYKAINSTEGQISLYWMCKHCFEPGRSIMKQMAEIIGKLNGYEKRFQDLENKENKGEETVKTYAAAAVTEYLQENPVQAVQKEEIIRSLKEEVKQDINAGEWPELQVADNIQLENRFQALVEEKLDERQQDNNEIREEEIRKSNLVAYGVEELVDKDKDKRTKHDKDEIIRISKHLGLNDFTEYNIMRILRMGTYTEGTSRPILVELDSSLTKHKIMRNTYKLKDVEEFKGWSLQHDMTKEQRENVRKLVDEAKRREAADTSGEYIYRVRGPPHKKYIKKIKKDQ